MSAYIIGRIDIRDREAFGNYMLHTPRVLNRFGGRFIVRGGETEMLEGPEETRRLVVIEFPSMDHASRFFGSEEYQETKKLREGGGDAQFVLVNGYPSEEWNRVLAESESLSL